MWAEQAVPWLQWDSAQAEVSSHTRLFRVAPPASAFTVSLCFLPYTRKEAEKKKKELCIVQQILPRTYSVVKKKKKRQRKMQICSFSFIFRRELYSSGVSPLAQ